MTNIILIEDYKKRQIELDELSTEAGIKYEEIYLEPIEMSDADYAEYIDLLSMQEDI